MANLTTVISDKSSLGTELACYVQSDSLKIVLPSLNAIDATHKAQYKAQKTPYSLPLGQLQLLELVIYLPDAIPAIDIESVCKTAMTSVLAWHKQYLSKHKKSLTRAVEVGVIDIRFTSSTNTLKCYDDSHIQSDTEQCLRHNFAANLVMEDLIIDLNDRQQSLPIFGWHDWDVMLKALHTPSELWRFLQYRLGQLKSTAIDLESENSLLTNFLNDAALFTQAIAIDNALIKYGLQDKPNSALISMALAQKNRNPTTQMHQQHMAQAAKLWSQMCQQMIEMYRDSFLKSDGRKSLTINLAHWQQQILDESLFSRHELIRTLYRHPKQAQKLQQQGYVIHQHSYESLGRHYVLIFYGQETKGKNSKKVIQPNLAKIALDVATRLPLAELHHIIVLGIDFIVEASDTFIDIDLWIQPVAAMSQRERQLSKQVQRLQQQGQK